MSAWKIQIHKRDKALARSIRKKQKEVVVIKEQCDCNGQSARKSIDFKSENDRKKMAQLFFRS